MTREAILLGLARKRIGIDDRIGRVGTYAVPLSEHPEFRSCFIPGSADEVRIARLGAEDRSDLLRARRNRWLRRAAAGLFLAAAGWTVYLGFYSRLFVLEGRLLDELQSSWVRASDAASPDPARVHARLELPHEAWVQGLAAGAEPSGLHWTVLLQQARQELWQGDPESLADSERTLHQVLAQAPRDPLAMTVLAEVLAARKPTNPNWLADATRAADRARAGGEEGVLHARALGALALAEGNTSLVLQIVDRCAETDLSCRMLQAEAAQDLAPLREAASVYRGSSRVQMALARTAHKQKAWPVLEDVSTLAVERWPSSAASWALLAEARAATGRWTLAGQAADKALALEPSRLVTQHLTSAVALRSGESATALAGFGRLIAQPGFQEYSLREAAWVQGGIAAFQEGDLVLAMEWCRSARAENSKSTGPLVLRAAIQLGMKDEIAAKATLRGIDHALLSGPSGAAMHMWAGTLFLDMGQQRLARNELEAAVAADPHWSAPRLELAWAMLDSGDTAGASSAIRGLAWMSPDLERVVEPRLRVDLGPPRHRPWRARLSKAMNQDVRLALLRPGTLAVLSWHEHPSGSSGELRAAIGSGDADIKLQAALAQALVAEEQWEEALEVLDPVLGSRSKAGYFQGLRGHTLSQLARDEASESAMARALKYAGDHPVVLWWAFDARWGAGDRAGSQAVIEAIEALDIDGPRLAGVLLAQRPLRE